MTGNLTFSHFSVMYIIFVCAASGASARSDLFQDESVRRRLWELGWELWSSEMALPVGFWFRGMTLPVGFWFRGMTLPVGFADRVNDIAPRLADHVNGIAPLHSQIM